MVCVGPSICEARELGRRICLLRLHLPARAAAPPKRRRLSVILSAEQRSDATATISYQIKLSVGGEGCSCNYHHRKRRQPRLGILNMYLRDIRLGMLLRAFTHISRITTHPILR
jgi:hypothetical protein